jgi:hypothetical protein
METGDGMSAAELLRCLAQVTPNRAKRFPHFLRVRLQPERKKKAGQRFSLSRGQG